MLIRGAVEMAKHDLAAGWIYATNGTSLRDELVLAFSGSRCVGEGRVEIYRQDLFDAGLGDGYCGFHFPIELTRNEHPASVVIKLADSDAVLLQSASRVGP